MNRIEISALLKEEIFLLGINLQAVGMTLDDLGDG